MSAFLFVTTEYLLASMNKKDSYMQGFRINIKPSVIGLINKYSFASCSREYHYSIIVEYPLLTNTINRNHKARKDTYSETSMKIKLYNLVENPPPLHSHIFDLLGYKTRHILQNECLDGMKSSYPINLTIPLIHTIIC